MYNSWIKTVVKVIAGIGIVVLAIWQIGIFSWSKEYIDDNVLNLPYVAEWTEANGIVSPWKNVQFHTGLMYRNLFLADSSFESVEMDLAESYEIREDGTLYAIKMRNNIEWSDGEPLTVEDVVFSIEAVLLASDVNGIYPEAFLNIEGAKEFVEGSAEHISGLTITDNTIYITMEQVYPAMIQTLAQFVILPKHVLEYEELAMLHLNEYWSDPVVSGMYKIGEIIPYETVRLVRNDLYKGDQPYIDEILLHVDYKHVDLDYYSTNNTTEIINYRSMRGMEGYQIDCLFYRYFAFNMCGSDGNENIAMQDVKVREAIAYAIDRESILHDIYFGSGELIDSGVPRSSMYYNDTFLEYDPEKAKALLAESDYDLDRPLRLLYYYTDSVSKYFMEEVKKDLEEIGFTVEVKKTDSTDELYELREYDMLLKGLSAFTINAWYAEYSSGNPNMSAIFGGVTEFDPLVAELNMAVEEDEIAQVLNSLQELEQTSFYKYPLFTLSQVLFIREERVQIPEDITFANTWYKYDVDFEEWKIKKE